MNFKVDGLKKLSEGNYKGAIESFIKARRVDPKDVEIVIGLVKCLRAVQDSKAAMMILKDTELKLDSNSIIFSHIAGIHANKGESIEAFKYYLKALELNPGNETYKVEMIVLLIRLGREEKGEELLDTAMKTHPENKDLIKIKKWFDVNKDLLN